MNNCWTLGLANGFFNLSTCHMGLLSYMAILLNIVKPVAVTFDVGPTIGTRSVLCALGLRAPYDNVK